MIGELSALLTAVLWTGSSISFAAATRRVGSIYVNVSRLIIASAVLGCIVAVWGGAGSVSARQAWYLAVSGFIGLTFGDSFLFKSYEFNSPRISSLVMSTAPAIAAMIGYATLGETLSWQGVIGMAITLGGIALVILQQHDPSSSHAKLIPIGIFYAFLGSVGQAYGLVLAKAAFTLGEINGFVATFYRVVVGAATLLPMMIAARRFQQPVAVFHNDRRALLLTILGAFLGPVFGITASLIAIANTSIAVAATLMATVPIMMLPAVRIARKEHLTWQAITGAIVSVAGVVILVWR